MNDINIREHIKVILCITLLYYFFHVVGIGCPIKFLTGISCAGCGMTRAWISVFHLNVKTAFYYHPLFILPAIYLVIFLLRNKIHKNIFKCIVIIGVILFVATYMFRMLNPDCVVNIDIQNSFIYKMLKLTNEGGSL